MASSEFRRLFERYMKCFDDLDGAAAAQFYASTGFVVKNGDVLRFGPADKVAYFSSLMEANARAGPHLWEIAELTVATPAANGAIVTVRWIARRPDQSVIWDFEDTYIVGDGGDGWRILGDIVHDD